MQTIKLGFKEVESFEGNYAQMHPLLILQLSFMFFLRLTTSGMKNLPHLGNAMDEWKS